MLRFSSLGGELRGGTKIMKQIKNYETDQSVGKRMRLQPEVCFACQGCSEEQFNRIVAILFIGVGIYYSIIINN